MAFKFETIGRISTLSDILIQLILPVQTVILCMMVLQLVPRSWLKLRNHVWNWKHLEDSGGDSSSALDFTNLEKSEAWVTTQILGLFGLLTYLFWTMAAFGLPACLAIHTRRIYGRTI